MSHLTKVKTKIKNLALLKQTLLDLNIKFIETTDENQLNIKAWNKDTEKVLLEIETGSSHHIGVALNKEDNTYEFVAEWWEVEAYADIKQEDFISKVTQKYAYNTVIDKIKDKGYQLVNEEVDDNKSIKITLRKWN